MRADIEITQFSKNYKLTQIKSTLLVLFALGVFERLFLAGETPMAREKSKNSHIDCRGSGCTVEEVEKLRKMKMEGKRGQRPKKDAYGKASESTYESLTKEQVYAKILSGEWKISEQPQQSPDAKWRKVNQR